MKRSAVAVRYARALSDSAGSLEDAARLAEQLKLFCEASNESKELSEVLYNPSFRKVRSEIVSAVATQAGFSKDADRALRFLVSRDRIPYLEAIVEAIEKIIESKTGKVRALVASPIELPKDRYQRIQAALERITGQLVVLDKTIDKDLIGGVVVRIGSVVYDGSIRTQLSQFKGSLGKET